MSSSNESLRKSIDADGASNSHSQSESQRPGDSVDRNKSKSGESQGSCYWYVTYIFYYCVSMKMFSKCP